MACISTPPTCRPTAIRGGGLILLAKPPAALVGCPAATGPIDSDFVGLTGGGTQDIDSDFVGLTGGGTQDNGSARQNVDQGLLFADNEVRFHPLSGSPTPPQSSIEALYVWTRRCKLLDGGARNR